MIKSICCIGAGYVGGPTMAVIAIKCPKIKVTVVDIDSSRIKRWNGPVENLPVFEPGLAEIVKKVRNINLFFSDQVDEAIKDSEMIFLAVNTPTKTSGEGAGMAADLKYIEASAKKIAEVATDDKIVIEKSTLPVRTAEKIKEILNVREDGPNFEILSNPEFLAEGTAIQDLYKSDRVLVGRDETSSGKIAAQKLIDIYLNWVPNEKIITSNIWSSELTKLASNAMLAQRISSINSLSALSEKTGAKTLELSRGIGMDHRIGKYFLNPSPGFGGSCFQKDILNLVYICRHYGLKEVAEYWHQVIKINNYQRKRISEIIANSAKNANSKYISILGWAFKKNTNDTRESSSIHISYNLIKNGFKIKVYDPKVKKSKIINDLTDLNLSEKAISKDIIISNVEVKSNIDEALSKSGVAAILTEWDEFRKIKFNGKIIDTRNICENSNVSFQI